MNGDFKSRVRAGVIKKMEDIVIRRELSYLIETLQDQKGQWPRVVGSGSQSELLA